MKTILLWDPRFPAAAPRRLAVADSVASAAVRAGVAAAADPADHAALATGGAVDPTNLVYVLIEEGIYREPAHLILPLAVASVGVAGGIAAVVQAEVAPAGAPSPTPTLLVPALSLSGGNVVLAVPAEAQAGDKIEVRISRDVNGTNVVRTGQLDAVSGATNASLPAGFWTLTDDGQPYYASARLVRGVSASFWGAAVAVQDPTPAPTLSGATSFSTPERAAVAITLTFSKPVVAVQLSGVQAAFFEVAPITAPTTTVTLRAYAEGELDFETAPTLGGGKGYSFEVAATDAGGKVGAAQTITVGVTDVDDTPTITRSSPATSPVTEGAPNGTTRFTYLIGSMDAGVTVRGFLTTSHGATWRKGTTGAFGTGDLALSANDTVQVDLPHGAIQGAVTTSFTINVGGVTETGAVQTEIGAQLTPVAGTVQYLQTDYAASGTFPAVAFPAGRRYFAVALQNAASAPSGATVGGAAATQVGIVSNGSQRLAVYERPTAAAGTAAVVVTCGCLSMTILPFALQNVTGATGTAATVNSGYIQSPFTTPAVASGYTATVAVVFDNYLSDITFVAPAQTVLDQAVPAVDGFFALGFRRGATTMSYNMTPNGGAPRIIAFPVNEG